MAKEIPLSQGLVAIVDDEDYPNCSQHKWSAEKYASGFRAVRNIRVSEKKKTQLMHRVIMKAPNHLDIDHINGDGLDNRKINLRLCSRSQNGMNRIRMNRNNTSGVRGVYFDKYSKKWKAQIGINGIYKHIGRFSNINEAQQAYLNASKRYHGEFGVGGA